MPRFKLFDIKYPENRARYVLQSAAGGLAVACALMLFDVVNQPHIIASLGASALVAFTFPRKDLSGPRHLIGGYLIGVTVGAIAHYLTVIRIEPYILYKMEHLVAAAIAVAVTMFLMAVTNTEHPPAGGIALGFVINDWTVKTLFLVIAAITVLSLIQRALKPYMIDLVGRS
jgi:CBS-domain-containing membrane protein